LRVAIATGGPSPDLGVLPEPLAEAKTKRGQAFEKLQAVRDVHGELAADLQTSENTVERSKYQLDLAVEAVVAEDAEALAVQWCRRFWVFDAVAGRKIRNDPDQPLRSLADCLSSRSHSAHLSWGLGAPFLEAPLFMRGRL
jgi:hypothetical protein